MGQVRLLSGCVSLFSLPSLTPGLFRERQERIESVGELVNQLESNEEARKLGRKTVEVRLEEELSQLQLELEKETMERQRRDTEISAALDKYTLQFQQSLNILNSDEFYDP